MEQHFGGQSNGYDGWLKVWIVQKIRVGVKCMGHSKKRKVVKTIGNKYPLDTTKCISLNVSLIHCEKLHN